MLPFLLAERGPLWDADVRGAFLGIRQHHTRGHFVRAAVEGVAFQLATILDGLESVEPVTSIRATGGVFRSALWREVLAGVLGRPLTVTAGAEGSALGQPRSDCGRSGPGALWRARCRPSPRTCSSPEPDHDDTVVASPASAAAYDLARVSAAQRLRDLAAAADLLAGPSRRMEDNLRQPTGNKRQLVVGADLQGLH